MTGATTTIAAVAAHVEASDLPVQVLRLGELRSEVRTLHGRWQVARAMGGENSARARELEGQCAELEAREARLRDDIAAGLVERTGLSEQQLRAVLA